MSELRKVDLLRASEMFSADDLSAVTLRKLARTAGPEGIDVKIYDHPGQPFAVIRDPGGLVAWGIGGSIGSPSAGARDVVTPPGRG